MDTQPILSPRRLIGGLLGLVLLAAIFSACGTATTPTATVAQTATPVVSKNHLPVNPPGPETTPRPTATSTPVPPTPTPVPPTPPSAPPRYLSVNPTDFHIASTAQANGCQGTLAAEATIHCQITVRSGAPAFVEINWSLVNATSGISF